MLESTSTARAVHAQMLDTQVDHAHSGVHRKVGVGFACGHAASGFLQEQQQCGARARACGSLGGAPVGSQAADRARALVAQPVGEASR